MTESNPRLIQPVTWVCYVKMTWPEQWILKIVPTDVEASGEKEDEEKGGSGGMLSGEKRRPECDALHSNASWLADLSTINYNTSNPLDEFPKARRTPDSQWDNVWSCLEPVVQKCKFNSHLSIWCDLKDTRWSIRCPLPPIFVLSTGHTLEILTITILSLDCITSIWKMYRFWCFCLECTAWSPCCLSA